MPRFTLWGVAMTIALGFVVFFSVGLLCEQMTPPKGYSVRIDLPAPRPYVAPKPHSTPVPASVPARVPTSARLETPRPRDVQCLAKNIYHEARGESRLGRYAVAWVTMNRVASAEFPNSVCAVVYQKVKGIAQFSWTDQHPAAPRGPAWVEAQRMAREVLSQRQTQATNPWPDHNVMFYHATNVSDAKSRWFEDALDPVSTIGDHIFYTLA